MKERRENTQPSEGWNGQDEWGHAAGTHKHRPLAEFELNTARTRHATGQAVMPSAFHFREVALEGVASGPGVLGELPGLVHGDRVHRGLSLCTFPSRWPVCNLLAQWLSAF